MQITKAPATMTSLELVDTINEVRAAEGKKPLRHTHFIAKIEKHPGFNHRPGPAPLLRYALAINYPQISGSRYSTNSVCSSIG